MRERLRRAGLRPISAVVDVTNYVMLELGQPMHAYDLRELEGGIVVRRAQPGETLKLLDGREVTLDETVLVIADRAKPLALAGVMGGDHSGIVAGDHATCCSRSRSSCRTPIAGRGRRYGLVTDASQRFERGVDPTLQERAIERATAAAARLRGRRARTGRGDRTARRAAGARRRRVSVRRGHGCVIGAPITDDGDGGDPAAPRHGRATRAPRLAGDAAPPWRFDIAIEEDLIEEVARVYGFDRIPETDAAVHAVACRR